MYKQNTKEKMNYSFFITECFCKKTNVINLKKTQ